MSLAKLKKKYSRKFKKESKSQIFILGSVGVGKSSLLKLLQQQLSMKDKGKQSMAGIDLESIGSISEEIYSYDYDKKTFDTMTKFIQQPTTKCVIFVIDSQKKHIINDINGNDIRSNIKDIAKIVCKQCHIIILCNKQDIKNEEILTCNEIGNILDIDRRFAANKHCVIGCSLTDHKNNKNNKDKDISGLISYLRDNNIINIYNITSTENQDEEKETKTKTKTKTKTSKKASFKNIFKKKNNDKVIMIFGLDGVGKTELLNAFNFGKKSKTNLTIFETEKLKHFNCEFHAWNYEERSWPMAKSFFVNTSLVIFVIDATKIENIKSQKKHVWTVDKYLKKLLGINANYERKEDDDNNNNNIWPLHCPFLFYLNKCDLDNAVITQDYLEKEIEISRLMKAQGIKYFVQECSAKSKKGVYDGLVWCYMNGILDSIPEIKEYAQKNEIK